MFKQYQLRNYNFRLLFYIILVTIMGILIVGSAQESSQAVSYTHLQERGII